MSIKLTVHIIYNNYYSACFSKYTYYNSNNIRGLSQNSNEKRNTIRICFKKHSKNL